MLTTDDTKRECHKRQRKGIQTLRLLSLLLFVAILVLSGLEGMTLLPLPIVTEEWIQQALFVDVLLFLLWSMTFRLLWNCNRLGKWLYWLLLLGSGYLYGQLWMPISSYYLQRPFWGLLLIWVGKAMSLLYGGGKLAFSQSIRLIWDKTALYGEPLEEDEEPHHEQPKEPTKMEQRLHRFFQHATLHLGICLYLGSFIIFFGMSIALQRFPDWKENLQILQYPLFSTCLFSMMIWSVPLIALGLEKSWSSYGIIVAFLFEGARILWAMFTHQTLLYHETLPSDWKLIYFGIQGLRYIWLFIVCRRIVSHPLLRLSHHISRNKE